VKKRLLKVIIVVFIGISILFPGPLKVSAETTTESTIDLSYFRIIMDYIKEIYNDGATDDQLIEGALKGIFGSMDQYTQFYTPEEAQQFFSDIGGEYGGIGISILKVGSYIQVEQVFIATPAEEAGIIPGDRIVSVNGMSVEKLTAEEVAVLIKGDAGTSVKLDIVKANETDFTKVTTITLVREIVKINPVSYEIRNDIAYLKIESFNVNTYEYFLEAIEDIDKNNIKKIILDIRNNPGGYVDQAVAVARHFVPEGLITKLDFKSQYSIDVEYYSDLKELKYNTVVLINEGTASASEILAGAIQDSKSGILVGTGTYGKSKIQSLIPILTPAAYAKYKDILGVDVVNAYDLIYSYGFIPSNDEVIGWTKITTGEYLTPLGRKIGNNGLIPYMWCEDPEPINDVYITSIRKLQKVVKPGPGYEGTDVYNAEKILRIAGYDVDYPDTFFDDKTFEAIKKFQSDKGLYSYGVLDFTTQQALNELYDELLLKYDGQYAWAMKLINN
jgi:carboxyl-terminal processing protease